MMNGLLGTVFPWLLLMTIPVFLLLTAGMCKLYAVRRHSFREKHQPPQTPIEVIIPVKGISFNVEEAVLSLLSQVYGSYQLLFVLESEDDSANAFIDKVCKTYGHARKIIAGMSECCGQKNHNLVQGALSLRPDTKIVVFCDSTNVAPPEWLQKFTFPIRQGKSDVVTTFRSFYPHPENIAGVSQTIYGTLILLLSLVVPKPWGGATAMRRSVFDRLDIIEEWSRTVVDDLVLGNVLHRKRISVTMDPTCALKSPLENQSLRGFLDYLDRQVMFPKYTNPAIWGALSLLCINFALAVPSAIVTAALLLFGGAVDDTTGFMSIFFLGVLAVLAYSLRNMLAKHVSLDKWFQGVVPFLVLSTAIVLRSVFRKRIDWHGKTYWCGREGRVLVVGSQKHPF